MATIVIDPGHTQGYNPGVCPGYFEGDAMLTLGRFLAEELSNYGANVIMTRTMSNENPSLAIRGSQVPNADLFMALHTNASDNANMRGVNSYYSVRLPESEPFAAEIGQAAADAMGTPFRGTIARPSTTNPRVDYYGVLRAAVNSGASNAFLIEHGYHTNPEDCRLLSDESVLRRIAAAEAEVIARYFGLTTGCNVIYTVQPMDSLYIIGEKFGTSWQNIASANNITAPFTLYIGQQLTIPVTYSCPISYTVSSGDSLYLIGQKFGIPWQEIASANNISAPYTLKVGQIITIPLPQA